MFLHIAYDSKLGIFCFAVSVLIILNDAKQIPLDRGKLNSDLVLAKANTLDVRARTHNWLQNGGRKKRDSAD